MDETPATLEDMMARIAELKIEEQKYKDIKEEMDELRFHVQLELVKRKSDRSEKMSGYMAIRKKTKSLIIESEGDLADWLEENVVDPMVYYKIDAAGIKKLAEDNLQTTGELLPGVKTVITESIEIRKAKSDE